MRNDPHKKCESDALKLHLFSFLLREKAKEWLLALSKGTITSWKNCRNILMTKFFTPVKTMQLRSKIIGIIQQHRGPLVLAW
jgi:hypothetical protein